MDEDHIPVLKVGLHAVPAHMGNKGCAVWRFLYQHDAFTPTFETMKNIVHAMGYTLKDLDDGIGFSDVLSLSKYGILEVINLINYPMLEREIAGRGITKKAIAESLGISQRSFSNKMSGRVPFTWPEVFY